jgi:hypothetical protein
LYTLPVEIITSSLLKLSVKLKLLALILLKNIAEMNNTCTSANVMKITLGRTNEKCTMVSMNTHSKLIIVRGIGFMI